MLKHRTPKLSVLPCCYSSFVPNLSCSDTGLELKVYLIQLLLFVFYRHDWFYDSRFGRCEIDCFLTLQSNVYDTLKIISPATNSWQTRRGLFLPWNSCAMNNRQGTVSCYGQGHIKHPFLIQRIVRIRVLGPYNTVLTPPDHCCLLQLSHPDVLHHRDVLYFSPLYSLMLNLRRLLRNIHDTTVQLAKNH